MLVCRSGPLTKHSERQLPTGPHAVSPHKGGFASSTQPTLVLVPPHGFSEATDFIAFLSKGLAPGNFFAQPSFSTLNVVPVPNCGRAFLDPLFLFSQVRGERSRYSALPVDHLDAVFGDQILSSLPHDVLVFLMVFNRVQKDNAFLLARRPMEKSERALELCQHAPPPNHDRPSSAPTGYPKMVLGGVS